jgi:hypothetical protein
MDLSERNIPAHRDSPSALQGAGSLALGLTGSWWDDWPLLTRERHSPVSHGINDLMVVRS